MRDVCRLLSTAAVAAAMTVGLMGTGHAQEATPTAMGEAGVMLSHLHQGNCAELSAEPVERLADLLLPEWATAMIGGDEEAIESAAIVAEDFGNAPVPVAVATTEIALPLTEIVIAQNAINIERADPADLEDSVACGNIGGIVDEHGDLFVGLEEQNDSGHHGIAWLHDNGASTTIVVFLAHPDDQATVETELAALAAAAMAEAEAEGEAETETATPEAESDAAATPVA
jgi:hypothetical protein